MIGGTHTRRSCWARASCRSWGYLQPLRYVGDSDEVLQFYHEVVHWWHVLPLTPWFEASLVDRVAASRGSSSLSLPHAPSRAEVDLMHASAWEPHTCASR